MNAGNYITDSLLFSFSGFFFYRWMPVRFKTPKARLGLVVNLELRLSKTRLMSI